MQTELAFPSIGRDDHQAAEDAQVATLEHQIELLTESGGKGTGEAHIVIPDGRRTSAIAEALTWALVAIASED